MDQFVNLPANSNPGWDATVGRKKGYEREALVARALAVFHARGYQRASTEVLVTALGVNRNSVYLEFGNKAGLFEAALELYEHTVISELFGPLEAPDACLDAVRRLFVVFAESAEASTGRGCLMINTAAELGGSPYEAQTQIDRYFSRIRAAFFNALSGAVAAGQVPGGLDTAAEADFLTASAVGIFVLVRSGVSTSLALRAIAAASRHLERLDGHTPPPVVQPALACT